MGKTIEGQLPPMIGKPMRRFDRLLRVMATQPEPSGKPAKDNRTSSRGTGAGYGDNPNSRR